jgi:hypothetical protein
MAFTLYIYIYIYIKADNDLIPKVTKIMVSPQLEGLVSEEKTQPTRHD